MSKKEQETTKEILKKYKTRNLEQEKRQLDKLLPVNVHIEEEDLQALLWLPVDNQTKLRWIDEIVKERKNL